MAMEFEVNRSQIDFPYWNPVRRRFNPDSSFFSDGNIERQLLAKQFALDLTEEEKQQVRSVEEEERSKIFCPIVGCGACLKSLYAFEDHYTARHLASCSVCSMVYPTSRLLSMHVSEVHDSFFQAKVARGYPMYECIVEGCTVKLESYESRKQHLTDKHKFPAAFEFNKKTRPSKKQRQKNHQRKQAIEKADEGSSDMQIEEDTIDNLVPAAFEFNKKTRPSKKQRQKKHQRKQAIEKADEGSSNIQMEEDTIDNLVSAVSKLSTSNSPSTIRFGRRHTRGLTFVPRAVEHREKQDPPGK